MMKQPLINQATETNSEYDPYNKISIPKGPFMLIAPNKLEYTMPRDRVFCYTLVLRKRRYFWAYLSLLGINPLSNKQTDENDNDDQDSSDCDHSSED